MLSRECSSNEPNQKHQGLFQHYRPKPEVEPGKGLEDLGLKLWYARPPNLGW